jgi:protein TonB
MKIILKNLSGKRSNLFGLFLLLSVLLHLLVGLVLQNPSIMPVPQAKIEETPVALLERKNWLELDQKPIKPAEKPPLDASHIAEANQQVKQEMAPKAADHRDQKRTEANPPTTGQQNLAKAPAQSDQTIPQSEIPPVPLNNQDNANPSPEAPAGPGQLTPPGINLPDLQKLTSLAPSTQARLDLQQDRPEIKLKGDEVWLNLREDDKLISFYRRFRDRIEAVWNYPVEAATKGIQGTLLIKIIINKKGELLDAIPLQSSGSDILDYEAIQAVYRAAPFGALPSYYPHEQLKIHAYFQYSINRVFMYGQP